MPLAPKPRAPLGRRRCRCRVCAWRGGHTVDAAMMLIVRASYTDKELAPLIRASAAAMLPPDGPR